MPKTFGSLIVDTSDIQKKFNTIKKTLHDPSGVFTKVLSDMKRRAPGKVADVVVENYHIKKKEITPQSSKAKTKKKLAGKIAITGEEIATMELTYKGRTLTLTHFIFSPNTVQKTHKYKVIAIIRKNNNVIERKKGIRKKSNPFILKSPQGIVMPFQRVLNRPNSSNSYYIKKDGSRGRMNESVVSERTLSLPQMIDNKKVKEKIYKDLGELLQKRLDHHMNQYLSK